MVDRNGYEGTYKQNAWANTPISLMKYIKLINISYYFSSKHEDLGKIHQSYIIFLSLELHIIVEKMTRDINYAKFAPNSIPKYHMTKSEPIPI